MSNSYDLSVNPNYMERTMFLDPSGSVTLQRFDTVKYPKIQQYEKVARGFFWVPEEIDLTKDKQDMKDATKAIEHMFTSNVLRQTALDSLQGKAPSVVFGPACSVPELEALMSVWSFFETNIHSNSYSHIIRNLYPRPAEVFDNIHNIKPIVEMAANVGKYYDNLHTLNVLKDLGMGHEISEYDHKKAVWLALHASYALEALRFMVSFATSLAMMENKIFIGNGNIIQLILQDELLHTEWTAWMIKQVVKEDPIFAQLKDDCYAEVYQIYMDVVREEKEWAVYLCKEGVVIGLNERILSSFVDWTAWEKLKDIGIKYICDDIPRSHPLPWFLKHTNINGKQTALQESESTNYIIGVMSSELDYEALPDL
jgi:ribonucleoside-diphosphate reductase beta chain